MQEIKMIWISWEHHRRTIEICRKLDIPLHEIVIDRSRIIRIVISSLITLRIINRIRPCVLITQNPSYFLNIWAVVLKIFYKFELIVDQHNEGVIPYNYTQYFYKRACRLIQRHADLNIVTNKFLKSIIDNNDGKAITLFDRIPEFPVKNKIPLPDVFNIVFVCTYSPDEPYENVIEAVAKSRDNLRLHVTGNYKKARGRIDTNKYVNVTFTGFMAEQDYIDLLYSCDAIIDLTTRDNCLVCGAYEAVALGKPLITSDTIALRELFYKGALFTDNSKETITECINDLLIKYELLCRDIKMLKRELNDMWEIQYSKVADRIKELCESHSKK
ncbi:MAG: glycosyltransferase [Gammaproteobacteria bacterium]|nr:MAG: glycosyltransferase [Gammaproteobacteria bacterium]